MPHGLTKEEMLQFQRELLKLDAEEHFHLEMTAMELFCIITCLKVAMTHPRMGLMTKAQARPIIRTLTDTLATTPTIRKVLESDDVVHLGLPRDDLETN